MLALNCVTNSATLKLGICIFKYLYIIFVYIIICIFKFVLEILLPKTPISANSFAEFASNLMTVDLNSSRKPANSAVSAGIKAST